MSTCIFINAHIYRVLMGACCCMRVLTQAQISLTAKGTGFFNNYIKA